MADGDLVISFQTEADAREFERLTKGVKLSAAEIAKIVRKLGGVLGDTLNEAYNVQLGARVDGLQEVKKLTKALSETEKQEKALERAINARRKADEGSFISIKNSLAQAKQLRNSLSKTNPQYGALTQKINELAEAFARVQGIEKGSLTDINFNIKDLERRLQIENLTADARARLTQEISNYNQKAREAQGIEEGSVAALKQQQQEQQRLADTLRIGSEAQRRAADNVRRLGDEIGRASPKTFNLISAFNKLATIQAGITAITSAFGQLTGSINQVVNRLKAIESFDLALQNIGVSASESSKFFLEASDAAISLGAPVEQIEKAYKRMVPSLRAMGTSTEDTNKFIKSLTARTQVLGLSTEESSRYMEAFAQVLSKGKLQGEELNQQISELDGSFRGQLADALGVTTAQLNEMVEQGEVTGDVLVEAFLNISNGVEILEGRLASGNGTIQQLQNNINNFNTKTLEEIGKNIEPGIRAFLAAGEAFAKLVNDIANSPLGELLAKIFNEIGNIVNIAVRIFADLARVLGVIVNPIAQILQFLSPLIALLVTLKTVELAAAAATVALANAKAYLATSSLKSVFAIDAATKSFGLFRSALAALLNLKVKQFLSDLTGSIGQLLRAMNIGVVNSFLNSLTKLTKIRTVADAVDTVSGSVGTATGFFTGLKNAVGGLGARLGNAFASVQAFGQRISKDVTNFFKYKRAVDGSRIAYDGLGRAAANATVDVTATAASLGREVVPALGRVGKTAGLANGQLATATRSAFAFGASLKAILVGGLALAGVTAILTAIAQVFSGMQQGASAAEGPVKELEGTLRQLGIETDKTHGAFLGFLDTLKEIPGFKQIGQFLNFLGDRLKAVGLAIGGNKGIDNLSKKFKDINDAAKEAGLKGLDDFANASKLTGAEAAKLTGGLRAQEKAALETAAAYETQIAELKKSGGATEAQIAELERLRNAAQASADKANYFATQWENATKGQVASQGTYEKTGDALKDVANAQAALFAASDAQKQAEITALQEQYNKGLISSAELAEGTATATEQSTQRKLAAIEKEKAALEQRASTSKEVDYAAFRRLQELQQQEAQLRAGADVQKQALSEAQLERLKQELEAQEKVGEAINGLASNASSAIGDIESSVGGALESLASAIESQAAIDFTITGDASFLRESLDAQAKILDFQYTIGAVKIAQQQAEKAFELELFALKMQAAKAEAEAAAATGDRNAQAQVALYERQLQIIPLIRQANDVTSEAALAGLKAQTQERQNQLNVAREAQGLPPIQVVDVESASAMQAKLDDLADKGKSVASQIGKVATEGIKEGVTSLEQGVQRTNVEIGKAGEAGDAAAGSFDAAVKRLDEGLKELNAGKVAKEIEQAGKKGAQTFNKEVEKGSSVIDKMVQGTKNIGEAFVKNLNPLNKFTSDFQQVVSLAKEFKSIVGLIPNFGGARAMGGPVVGGQSYLVNDGGGREAFMSKSGQLSLLPAGRNIRWRAPGDGFVLPAPMTETLVQNSKINAKIAAVNKASTLNPNANYASGVSNSGNLIQQMGAMMGSANTQRITNNVTIQSQSPVMDASKIMANVARLKARRGIRG